MHGIRTLVISTLSVLAMCGPILAQDRNLALPVAQLEQMLAHDAMRIEAAQISRPTAKGDITLRAEVSFAGREPLRVKLRKSVPGAEGFNNIPRYDLAAYALQRLLMDPHEYVVPPTALRMIALAEFRRHSPDVLPTFKGSDDALGVVQYWLRDIEVVADVFDAARFASDPVYARHIGQLNVFTFLLRHGDSNAGNFLISKTRPGPRVFSVDHGIAFGQAGGDRGMAWRTLRVARLPADTIARVRQLTSSEALAPHLGVLAQWELREGHFVPVPPGENVAPNRGVRIRNGIVQMGLTRAEIAGVARQAALLVKQVDSGKIEVY